MDGCQRSNKMTKLMHDVINQTLLHLRLTNYNIVTCTALQNSQISPDIHSD